MVEAAQELPQFLDLKEVADAVCELLKRSRLVSETPVPVDENYPRHRWYRNWGIDVRFGQSEGKKAGFILFRFLTPDNIIIETFELDGNQLGKPKWRNYLDERFAQLSASINQHRKERREKSVIDVPKLILPDSVTTALH